MNEFALIDLIKASCSGYRADVRLGIGDDAAVVGIAAGQDLVACVDTLIAGRHFPLNTRPEDIGWKSLAVNLSDLAAMGAKPAFALLALSLPEADADWVRGFMHGFSELAKQFGVALIGGDTTRGPLSITVTAMGFVPSGKAIRRQGAQPGERLIVCGALGAAAAGLHFLASEPECGRSKKLDLSQQLHRWVQKLDRPLPQVDIGLRLRGVASACIDLSDGLLSDVAHLLRASDCAAEIDLPAIPGYCGLAEALGTELAQACVLSGGDDYVLVASIPELHWEQLRLDLKHYCGLETATIGRITSGSGITVYDGRGQIISTARTGWDHFG